MINQFDFKIKELENMKKYPKELYFIGNTQLLKRKKIYFYFVFYGGFCA